MFSDRLCPARTCIVTLYIVSAWICVDWALTCLIKVLIYFLYEHGENDDEIE